MSSHRNMYLGENSVVGTMEDDTQWLREHECKPGSREDERSVQVPSNNKQRTG